MITPKRAVEIVRKKYPKGDLYNGFLYRDLYYVFRLQETKEPTLGSTFLAVNRKTGSMSSVTPAMDIRGFFSDMSQHPIKVEGVLSEGVLKYGV